MLPMQGLSTTNLFGLIDCIKDGKALINWGTEGKILLSAVGVGRPRGSGTPSFLTITAPLLRLAHGTGDAQPLKLLSVDRRDRSSLGHRRTSPGSAVRGDGRGARGLPRGAGAAAAGGSRSARPGPGLPLTDSAAAAGPCRARVRRAVRGGAAVARRRWQAPPRRGGGCAAAAERRQSVRSGGRARHAALSAPLPQEAAPRRGRPLAAMPGPGRWAGPAAAPHNGGGEVGTAGRSLCVRPERCGMGMPCPGLCAGMRGAAAGTPAGMNASCRGRLPSPGDVAMSWWQRRSPSPSKRGASVRCAWDGIKDVREAGRGVFAEMEVRGRGLGCRTEGCDAGQGGRVPDRGVECRTEGWMRDRAVGCRTGGCDAGQGGK